MSESPRSPSATRVEPTEPEDFEELLDELVNQAELSPALKLWDKLAAARQRVESHVSRLREERDALQQTGLTAEEASAFWQFTQANAVPGVLYTPMVNRAIEKLRSLAALRSLEGEGK